MVVMLSVLWTTLSSMELAYFQGISVFLSKSEHHSKNQVMTMAGFPTTGTTLNTLTTRPDMC